MSKSKDLIRLNLVVNRHVKDRIERLQELSEGVSLTEVVRRSLATYEQLLLAQQQGSTIVLERPLTTDEQLILGRQGNMRDRLII